MKNYNQNNRSDRGRPSMHRAVCDKCKKDCEVPFKPTSNKPVYCSNCFRSVEPRKSSGREFQKSGFSNQRAHKAVCDKCRKDCEVPFKPTSGKPVYCNDCFGKDKKGGTKDNNQLNEQFVTLNTKLDEILNILASSTLKTKPKKKEALVKIKKVKPKKPVIKKKTTKKK